MKKKTYITPSMKVKHIACTHMLCISGEEERTLKSFSPLGVEGLGEDYSQW